MPATVSARHKACETFALQGHSSGAAAAMRYAEADKVAGRLQHWRSPRPKLCSSTALLTHQQKGS